jgi:NAD(P)-dependent dehydrogenase (short-subunit alcohol dehydrogenase family)
MTRAMAAQHGLENIRVNCVCPGMVFTPMVRGRGMTDEMRQAVCLILLPQATFTDEVASAYKPELVKAGGVGLGRRLW